MQAGDRAPHETRTQSSFAELEADARLAAGERSVFVDLTPHSEVPSGAPIGVHRSSDRAGQLAAQPFTNEDIMRLFNPMEATASSTARGTAASSTFSFDNDEDDTAFPPPPSRPITSAPDPPRNASTISSNLHDVLEALAHHDLGREPTDADSQLLQLILISGACTAPNALQLFLQVLRTDADVATVLHHATEAVNRVRQQLLGTSAHPTAELPPGASPLLDESIRAAVRLGVHAVMAGAPPYSPSGFPSRLPSAAPDPSAHPSSSRDGPTARHLFPPSTPSPALPSVPEQAVETHRRALLLVDESPPWSRDSCRKLAQFIHSRGRYRTFSSPCTERSPFALRSASFSTLGNRRAPVRRHRLYRPLPTWLCPHIPVCFSHCDAPTCLHQLAHTSMAPPRHLPQQPRESLVGFSKYNPLCDIT